jgi:DtxR family Mn-dependent transcriptional regulator
VDVKTCSDAQIVIMRTLGNQGSLEWLENGGIDMELSDRAEEILERLWTDNSEGKSVWVSLQDLELEKESPLLKELEKESLVEYSVEGLSLTSLGLDEAKKVVRRHRLAERLLIDVLDTDPGLVEDAACRFEHVLRSEVEENVCTLLGHPRVCPHGLPIPFGRCCKEDLDEVNRVVYPLSEMGAGQRGRIMYIHTHGESSIKKLMAMGVLPGLEVSLIQRFPSYVFNVGQTQIAVDEEIASEIFVLVSQ